MRPCSRLTNPGTQDLSRRLAEPMWSAAGSRDHPLGTDHLGRGYLALLLYGGRISLFIGFATLVISTLIGTTLGSRPPRNRSGYSA